MRGLFAGARIHGPGLALLVFASGATCTDANDSLMVLQAQVPDEECIVSDEASAAGRLEHGILDVALDKPYGYNLYPLVVNNLLPIGGEGEVEPNRVNVSGAQVKILPPPGVEVPFTEDCSPEFDHPSQALIPPGGTRTIRVEALRSCHTTLFRQLFASGRLNPSVADSTFFRVEVRAKGRHGGTQILSAAFEFPVRVCYGCLQTGYSGPYSVFNFPEVPACDQLAENPFQGNRCHPAQDFGPILCCARDASGAMLECPGLGRAPSSTSPDSGP